MLDINLFGSYNVHFMVMTKLSSWKKRFVESTGRNSSFMRDKIWHTDR